MAVNKRVAQFGRGAVPEEQLPAGALSEPDLSPAMVVDVSEQPEVSGDSNVRYLQNGNIEVDGIGASEGATTGGTEHDDNLADRISESACATIAQEVCEAVEADLRSRSEWQQRLADGLELLGVREPSANLGVFKMASKINHPVIAEAAVQFQARAIAELFPSSGPAKGVPLGRRTKELEEQAERVADYLNWQLTFDDRAYFEDFDQLLFMLGLEGSQFKKGYHDPVTGKNRIRWVRVENFVVPYSATSLRDARRYTEIMWESDNEVRKKVAAGQYRDVDLGPANVVRMSDTETPLQAASDQVEGRDAGSMRPEDAEHQFYEQHVDLIVEGFEDRGMDGEDTGIARPYIAVVDKDSQSLMSLRRNWKEDDQTKAKRIWYTHYKYLPGPGFYGLGLLHMISGLGNAATGVLRAIMVSAALASAGGGFKSKEGRGLQGSISVEPGVFKDTDLSHEELAKAFYQPQFKETPPALFQVLGHLTDAAQRFASTTENMVGDANNTGPVGTTVALIEQGSKVFSGIHKRCHASLGEELSILAALNGEYMPEEGYPYAVEGADRQVFRTDFDDKVDVQPVSDPNIFSSTQRIAIAQAQVDAAEKAPDIVDRREAVRRLFVAMRVPDIDAVIPDRNKVARADAVTENALAGQGVAIRAFMDQDDVAHNTVHGAWLQDAQANSRATPQAMAVMQSHMSEHEANRYRKEIANAAGIPIVPMNLNAEPGEPVVPTLPPEMENQITAKAAAYIAQQAQQQQPQEDPAAIEAKGKVDVARERMQAELKIKGDHEAGLTRIAETNAKAKIEIARFTATQMANIKRAQADFDTALQNERQVGESSRAMAKDEAEGARTQAKDGVGNAQKALAQAVEEMAAGMDSLSNRLNDVIQHVAGQP